MVRGVGRDADARGTALAVAVAGCIAGYTLVDDEGMEHAAALPYLELVLAGPALVYAGTLVAFRGRPAVRAEIGVGAIGAGIAMFAAYACVLAALDRAAAAPVAAVRESSVVIATLLAASVLRERVTPMRLAGAVLVTAGVAVVALA
jgi:drug/metabolite transporter (DMT)-like permease